MGAVTYTWSTGATGETITLTQSDVGSTITVTASYTDAQGTAETMASAATAAVANVNDSPTGAVTITGTAAEDQVLTASNSLADEDGMGAVTYTWSNGATGDTITLAQSDVDSAITVTASYTDAQGTAETMASAATTAVANVNDPAGVIILDWGNTQIVGDAEEGVELTATVSDEDGMTSSIVTYAWQSSNDGSANSFTSISGATTNVFTPGTNEVGKVLRLRVIFTDDHSTIEDYNYTLANVVLASSNDAPTGSVTITGTAKEDQVLTASNSLADED